MAERFEAELLKDDWTQVRPEVEVKQVALPQGEETYILCRTAGRKEKEKAIRKRFSTRTEEALKGLGRRCCGEPAELVVNRQPVQVIRVVPFLDNLRQ